MVGQRILQTRADHPTGVSLAVMTIVHERPQTELDYLLKPRGSIDSMEMPV